LLSKFGIALHSEDARGTWSGLGIGRTSIGRNKLSSVAFIINKDAVNNNIFIGALAMLSMIGKSTSVLVLSDAIGLDIFYTHLGSLDKVPFVNHCCTKIGSVECLDWEIPLSILHRNMCQTTNLGWSWSSNVRDVM